MTDSKTASSKPGTVRRLLTLEELSGLCGELQPWRTDPGILTLPSSEKATLVFPFAKGQRLSARLTYALRNALAGSHQVDWGQLLTDEDLCSPECDIIIHTPGSKARWNGSPGQVLDFHFVELAKVVAVISCKSMVTSVDESYCRDLMSFGVQSVGLMGEACQSSAFKGLKDKATKAGYCDFWCLALEDAGVRTCDEHISLGFVQYLESL